MILQMKKNISYIFSLILSLILIYSCSTTSQPYGADNNNKTYKSQLSDSNFIAIKQYLTKTTNSKLLDTIIIKYDFNNENCWSRLDENNDDYIMGFVTRHKERVQKVLATRPNVSVFDFREPGNNLNKIKKWDNSIIIDSSKQLFNLLFRERCTCGSSIIIMPDKRFIFLRSDSHSEILDLTQKQIEQKLK
jgi:hypothetical protein